MVGNVFFYHYKKQKKKKKLIPDHVKHSHASSPFKKKKGKEASQTNI